MATGSKITTKALFHMILQNAEPYFKGLDGYNKYRIHAGGNVYWEIEAKYDVYSQTRDDAAKWIIRSLKKEVNKVIEVLI
ncbi:MAG: hypothetical protein LC122_13735 [Chitinophagales bacterium]|nr:hypothetical protein [Chitinophagales bacterium]